MAANVCALVGASPFLLLGLLHLLQVLRDLHTPRHWVPSNPSLIAEMRASRVIATAKGPGSRDLWITWQGANVTHSLGLLTLVALVSAPTLADGVTRPVVLVAAVAGAAYCVAAWRFWFLPAAILAALGTTGFVVATVLA